MAQVESCDVYVKRQKIMQHMHYSKHVWLLGRSSCSSPSTKALHEQSIYLDGNGHNLVEQQLWQGDELTQFDVLRLASFGARVLDHPLQLDAVPGLKKVKLFCCWPLRLSDLQSLLFSIAFLAEKLSLRFESMYTTLEAVPKTTRHSFKPIEKLPK